MDVEKDELPTLKRPLDADDGPIAKRSRRPYKHYHSIQPLAAPEASREPAFVNPEIADKLLLDAITSIVLEEGAKQAICDPVIESLALTAFQNAVEEYMLKFCSKVRRSMHAARRSTPIAPDFENAIAALDVPRLDDQLKQYQTQPEINRALLPTPPPEDSFHKHAELPASLLGPELDTQDALKRFHRKPSFLPPLPSAHTYRATAVFPKRETDSRRMRELATEEGKLGEQALRKLAGAVKLDAAHPVDTETHKQALSSVVVASQSRRRKKKLVNEAALFEDTMRHLLRGELDGFELGPIVTSEKALRMPDDGQNKRRPRTEEISKGADAKSAPSRSSDPRMEGADPMDL